MKLMDMFPDDDTAEARLVKIRWPKGVHCPECGSDNVQTNAPNKKQPYRCRERQCRLRFSAKTGTVMHGSNLPYRKCAIATYLCLTSLKGVSSMKLIRDIDITRKSAWHMAMRLRKALEDGNGMPFAGPVEPDETYIGGKRKNMSLAKRKELKGAGRGTVGKEAMVGVKDRETNRVRSTIVPVTDAPHVTGFVATQAEDGAKVYTDEDKVYNALKPFYDHEAVNRGVGEYVRDVAHANGMESFRSMLKRGFIGTLHKMSPKHLDKYVAEFSERHNVRDADTIAQMEGVVVGMNGKHLRYSDLTADNGLPSGARR